MKLRRKDLKLMVEIMKTIPNTKITPEIDNLFTDIYQSLNKPQKYFPIETAPIKQAILVWDTRRLVWTHHYLENEDSITIVMEHTPNYTHWRPMPKGPKQNKGRQNE